MLARWHQFWLLLCALGLWWWGLQEPPPKAPWTATVTGHEHPSASRTLTRVALDGQSGAPASARLARYGLRHEPGQVIAVYPVPGEPGVVEEWTGREWPWLYWLTALALAHILALLAAGRPARPRLQAWLGSLVGLCWLALLWFAVVHASQARVELLLTGATAEGVVVGSEITSSRSRGRSTGSRGARHEAIVHFAASAAQPPRDLQVNVGSRFPEYVRVPLLYLPDTPARVLVLSDSSSRLSGWWLPVAIWLASLALTVFWLRSRLWRIHAAAAATVAP